MERREYLGHSIFNGPQLEFLIDQGWTRLPTPVVRAAENLAEGYSDRPRGGVILFRRGLMQMQLRLTALCG